MSRGKENEGRKSNIRRVARGRQFTPPEAVFAMTAGAHLPQFLMINSWRVAGHPETD